MPPPGLVIQPGGRTFGQRLRDLHRVLAHRRAMLASHIAEAAAVEVGTALPVETQAAGLAPGPGSPEISLAHASGSVPGAAGLVPALGPLYLGLQDWYRLAIIRLSASKTW